MGSTWAWTVNMTGVIMAVILFSAYDFKTFLKPVYLVYSAVCVIALPLAYWWWNLHQAAIYRDKLLTAVINVWLLGALLIRLLLDGLVYKTKKLHFSKLEIIVVTLLLWMFFSVNEDIWPMWFLVMFELFYHTDYTEKDMIEMKHGLLNGIILGFFILQGAAFVFRPFDDEYARYCGIYANYNINALFYCVVLVAFLLKLFFSRKYRESKLLIIMYTLFSGAMLGFLVLTITRTAWLSMLIVMGYYALYSELILLHRKAINLIASIVIIGVIFAISIPIEYIAVRYIPPMFHHPIWYEGEYTEEKVHSWDPWDSEKYVTYEEFINAVWTRVEPYIDIVLGKLTVQAKESEGAISGNEYSTTDRAFSSARGRLYIWKYYIKNGNVRGHLSSEGHIIEDLQIYVWHTQNMFIQFWYYYGIPSAVLLTENIPEYVDNDDNEIRIAFDGDAVLFSEDSELIYKKDGLDKFKENERVNADNPLQEDPF
ncbi:MAG: 5'-nucleotidase, partial [Lachnospiraceae bacterium]